MLVPRLLALLFALPAIAIGILWVGQGTGLIVWPADSFMIEDRGWAVRGAMLIAVGMIVIWLAWRGNRRD